MADIFSGDFPRNFARARSGGLSFCLFRLGLPDFGESFAQIYGAGFVADIFLRAGGAYLFLGLCFFGNRRKKIEVFFNRSFI